MRTTKPVQVPLEALELVAQLHRESLQAINEIVKKFTDRPEQVVPTSQLSEDLPEPDPFLSFAERDERGDVSASELESFAAQHNVKLDRFAIE